MKIHCEITEATLKQLIYSYMRQQLGDAGDNLRMQDIKIEVKSKQNYKSEWEQADFRATYTRV